MHWLLYDSCRIETADTAAAVMDRIKAGIDRVDCEAPGENLPLFEGVVRGDAFRLFRIIRGRNLFLPLIQGRVLSTPQGAAVEIRMRPHGFAIASLAVWFGLIVLLPLCSIWTHGDVEQWLKGQMAGLVFAVFVYTMAGALFGREARLARESLTKLINTSSSETKR